MSKKPAKKTKKPVAKSKPANGNEIAQLKKRVGNLERDLAALSVKVADLMAPGASASPSDIDQDDQVEPEAEDTEEPSDVETPDTEL